MTPVVILVKPQLPINIGSVARVAKNFDCNDLRIVVPKKSFIDAYSIAISAGADDILKNAKIYDDLPDALSDLHEVYAFTARKRYSNKPLVDLKEIAIKHIAGSSIGLMFGPENSGLSNQEIAFANKQVFIQTNPCFSSLNLSHAVAIALTHFYLVNEAKAILVNQELAPMSELNDFLQQLEQSLLKTEFLKLPEKREKMIINIKNIFTRIESLTSQEVRTLRGIITALDRKK